MESFQKSDYRTLEEWVMAAREEAFNRGIEANTIVINKNLAFVKEFLFKDPYFGVVTMIPPMIMGMEIFVEDMPDKKSFLMFKATKTERDRAIEQIQQETAKAILQEIYKKCDDLVADYSTESIDFVDFAQDTLLTELCNKYGVRVDK